MGHVARAWATPSGSLKRAGGGRDRRARRPQLGERRSRSARDRAPRRRRQPPELPRDVRVLAGRATYLHNRSSCARSRAGTHTSACNANPSTSAQRRFAARPSSPSRRRPGRCSDRPAPSPTTPTRCTEAAMHGNSIEPSSSTGVTSSSSTLPRRRSIRTTRFGNAGRPLDQEQVPGSSCAEVSTIRSVCASSSCSMSDVVLRSGAPVGPDPSPAPPRLRPPG